MWAVLAIFFLPELVILSCAALVLAFLIFMFALRCMLKIAVWALGLSHKYHVPTWELLR